jgi:signal peptidase I
VALVIALLVKTFVVQAFYIPSGSMENTLRIHDKVLVNKLVYRIRSIQPGDIVVFNGAGSWNAPTAASTSGDPLVRLYDVTVTINGVALHEKSYLYPGNTPGVAPQDEPGHFRLTVPAGRLWVLGDHRAVSDDSRGHEMDPGNGTIPESAVIGRAFVIAWPPSHWRVLRIPATFIQPGIDRKSSAIGGAGGAAGSSSALSPSLVGAGQSVRLRPSAPYLPLGAGLAGAVPVTYWRRRFVLRNRAAGVVRARTRR